MFGELITPHKEEDYSSSEASIAPSTALSIASCSSSFNTHLLYTTAYFQLSATIWSALYHSLAISLSHFSNIASPL
jgi:hypothetical protein